MIKIKSHQHLASKLENNGLKTNKDYLLELIEKLDEDVELALSNHNHQAATLLMSQILLIESELDSIEGRLDVLSNMIVWYMDFYLFWFVLVG